MSDRREFLKDAFKSAATFVLAAAVPVALTKSPPDPYGAEFVERVRHRVIHIVQREGQPVRDLTIEAPTPDGFRFVRLRLEGISQPFTFNVPWKD